MDGIHDMGGMHGFGAVAPEPDEPVFHEPWEGRAFGLALVGGALGLVPPGTGRGRIERIDPATYLASSYYERWARGMEEGLVEAGTLTAAEIDARAATGGTEPVRSEGTDADTVALVPTFLNSPQPTSGAPAAGAFAVGDRVTVRRMAPAAHHRCPRYVRGATGTVARIEGAWPRPGDDAPEAVYSVRFANADLWGDDAEPGSVTVDLWEGYLT
ncbi:MAG TPA: nitrile hydratase subunit beta [Acidimicrobiales bacterium]|nr:nitrile hydratase subunit beta [Acidimicrobiales bacterium]